MRVKVIEGGCSGFEYKKVIDGRAAKDRGLEKNGACIFLNPLGMLHLNSTEIVYKDSLMQSGFVFNNPNFKGTCDCGSSFAV